MKIENVPAYNYDNFLKMVKHLQELQELEAAFPVKFAVEEAPTYKLEDFEESNEDG